MHKAYMNMGEGLNGSVPLNGTNLICVTMEGLNGSVFAKLAQMDLLVSGAWGWTFSDFQSMSRAGLSGSLTAETATCCCISDDSCNGCNVLALLPKHPQAGLQSSVSWLCYIHCHLPEHPAFDFRHRWTLQYCSPSSLWSSSGVSLLLRLTPLTYAAKKLTKWTARSRTWVVLFCEI